ncbi:MAG TPA: minor capsid protein [Trichocoleus sp.]|jgi:SPP1 gp7 family putative phage head morphogenesis protein
MEDALRLLERTDRTLRRLEDSEVERLNKSLDNSYLRLEKDLLRNYPQYSADAKPGLLGTQRSVLLLGQIKDQLILINPEREKELTDRYEKLLQTASQEGSTLAEELVKLQQGDDFVKATATVPIEAAAIAARESIDRLKKHDQKFRENASTIITQGIIQGWGAMRVASQLRQQLGVAKGRAEAIARTEVLNANNGAAQQTFKDYGYEYFQLIATADDRTCPTCLARNMQVYKLGESKPPLHPRCRCFSMPWSPEHEEQGKNDWTKAFAATALADFNKTGKTLETGATSFERAAGIVAAVPLWTATNGFINKEVERKGQEWAGGLLAATLLLRGQQQQAEDDRQRDELLKTLLVGAALVGVGVGTYYLARQRYRAGFKDSARMAEAMIADLDLEDIADDDEFITLAAGGFGGSQGKSGLKHAELYKEFLQDKGHKVIGFEIPDTDRAKSITEDPVGHISTNWGGLINRAIVEGRNPDAVKMAATAAAYYRKTGKPVNLVGYSAGGFVASEAQEILKLMGVPVRTAAIGTPHFGFTDLGRSEMRGFVGDGDIVGTLPVQNRVTVSGVKEHWHKDYMESDDFKEELAAWLSDKSPRSVSTPAEEDWLKREADRWDEWRDQYTPQGKYKEGFAKSAQMAREMAKEYDRMAKDFAPDDETDYVTFIAGGFAGQKGQVSAEYADIFQEFMENHLVIGTPTPEFDTDIDLRKEPIRHLLESWRITAETYFVKGRNMSSVRMAAQAYAYYKAHGKPINLIGYSGGGMVASEAAEILKKMGVPAKVLEVATPNFGFTNLSADEHRTLIGKGDPYLNFPLKNARILQDVDAHWLDGYLNSESFYRELNDWLDVRSPDFQPPKRRSQEPDLKDYDFVEYIPQLQLLGVDELDKLPEGIKQKILAARKENLQLPGGVDPKLLEGVPELLALPAAREQIAGLLRGVPQPNLLPGVKELLALPGVESQIKGLLAGIPDPKLLPGVKELLALPAIKGPLGLLTGRLDPKLLKGIPEPLLLEGYQELLMLPGVESQIKGLLRGEVPPLQLPAGTDIKIPVSQQEIMLKQTQRQLYERMRSMQRRFSRGAEQQIRDRLQEIATSDLPPFGKLEAYRKAVLDELQTIAQIEPSTKPLRGLSTKKQAYEALDENGEFPSETDYFYHATTEAGAKDILLNGVDPDRTKVGMYGKGFYVTNDIEEARYFATLTQRTGNPVYLKMYVDIKNPKLFDDFDAYIEYFKLNREAVAKTKVPRKRNPDLDDKRRQFLKNQGYDAISVDGETILFDNSQAKIFDASDSTEFSQSIVPDIKAAISKESGRQTFNFMGLNWSVPELKPNSSSLDLIRKLVDLDLPDNLLQATKNIAIVKERSPSEEFWRKRLKLPVGPVPATINFEDASVTLHGGRGKVEDTLRQMAYLYAYQQWGQLDPPKGSLYAKAMEEGRPITTYGFDSPAADFADSVAQFFVDSKRLKKFNRARYEIIARMLNYRHPEEPLPPREPDTRSPEIISNLRNRNFDLTEQSKQQREQAETIAQQQRSPKKIQQAIGRINQPKIVVQAEDGISRSRAQEETINRIEGQVEELEQRSAQLLNPFNKPYFSEVPARIKETNRQLKAVDRELKDLEKIGTTAAKVRANLSELQQTLADLATRKESLKLSSQGQKITEAVNQLQQSASQAEQELAGLPQSPERSQALRELLRLRAAINAQQGGVSVADLHRQALQPRIQQIEALAESLGNLESRVKSSRSKLTDLQARLSRLPAKLDDLSDDQRARYNVIKSTRVAQGKLPQQVEQYREVRQQFTDRLAAQSQQTQQITDNYNSQKQNAINNVQAIVEDRLKEMSDRLQILTTLQPGSVAWLVDRRNWESDLPDDLAIVLAREPGKSRTERLERLAEKITTLVAQVKGGANLIEQRLQYPDQVKQQTLEQAQQQLQQWQQIRDALADEGRLSDRQLAQLLKDPSQIKAVDVMRYGNQLVTELEEFNRNFVQLLLNEEGVDPRSIIDQAELYRRAREAFTTETTQTRTAIAREIEDSLAVLDALQKRIERDRSEPTIYEVNGKARTAADIKAELDQARETIADLLKIKQVAAKVQATEEEEARQQQRQQVAQDYQQRQRRLQTLKDELAEVNLEIQKRREARERGQKRGIAVDRLEAQQRRIMKDIEQIAREHDRATNSGTD